MQQFERLKSKKEISFVFTFNSVLKNLTTSITWLEKIPDGKSLYVK